ncbi:MULTISPECIES: glutaredoxin family protein [unclassified Nocardioides]|uniref:glutaredoxin family protein n=1 Tax=unclassified Nocardioides TaxID=2615069 RepID=UPI002405A4C2|nr:MULTISPECIES: glutaredoxin family protein [unclassified Nocardioides]
MSLPPISPGDARVVLYGREGCHLCDEARAVVAQVCAELGERFVEVDVDEDDEAATAARIDPDEIPVTFVDGRQHDFWRVDAERLRSALTA